MIPRSPAQIQQRLQFAFEYVQIRMNVWALGQYGPDARQALPALSNLLNGSEMGLRSEAKLAIEKITAGTNQVSQ